MVAMGWQRPGAGQEAERHSPCVALRRECTESAARWVRMILDRLHRIHIRSWLPLLHCSPLATRCAFRPFPPAQVCTSSTAGNINAAWHAQAEAARLSAPLQLESAAWRGASFHQSSGCSACALLERRRVASHHARRRSRTSELVYNPLAPCASCIRRPLSSFFPIFRREKI